jgi:hypothetical protein
LYLEHQKVDADRRATLVRYAQGLMGEEGDCHLELAPFGGGAGEVRQRPSPGELLTSSESAKDPMSRADEYGSLVVPPQDDIPMLVAPPS